MTNEASQAGASGGVHAALRAQAKRLTLSPGSVLFHQGDPADEMFAIERGRLKLWRTAENGAALTLGYYNGGLIDGGDFVGAIAILQDRPHSVTASAVSELVVLTWPAALVRRMVREDPVLAMDIAVVLARRADGLVSRVEDLSSPSVEARIARVLVRYATAMEQVRQDANGTLDLTQREIGELTSTTVPTVSRILKRWRAAGIVRGGRGQLTILDVAALSALRGLYG